MISDYCSLRGGLTGKISLQFQYFGASPRLASGMSTTCITRRKYRAGYGIFTFSLMYHFLLLFTGFAGSSNHLLSFARGAL